MREFTQAEIEHFVHPDDKKHAKFGQVAGLAPLLYSRALQMGEVGGPCLIAGCVAALFWLGLICPFVCRWLPLGYLSVLGPPFRPLPL